MSKKAVSMAWAGLYHTSSREKKKKPAGDMSNRMSCESGPNSPASLTGRGPPSRPSTTSPGIRGMARMLRTSRMSTQMERALESLRLFGMGTTPLQRNHNAGYFVCQDFFIDNRYI